MDYMQQALRDCILFSEVTAAGKVQDRVFHILRDQQDLNI